MNYSVVGILDLPDEILLIILTKLKNADVLYSLMDVNERFDKMACDTIFTQCIDLVALSSNGESGSLSDLMLDRFRKSILPRIHQNVECLTLEPLSMECILRAGDYPNLRKLNLVKLELEQALHLLNAESPLVRIFKEQISHLTVTVTDDSEMLSLLDLSVDVYARIFNFFTSLTHLEFGTYNTSQHLPLILYDLPSNICFSSTIVHLCIRVLSFDACLYLLDGRLNQMNTFIVTVEYFMPVPSSLEIINNTKGLHNLKCFSLMSCSQICTYDDEIAPLLRQMSQLEKLTLSLNVHKRTTFIEGTHLNNEILSQMSHLHTFIFDIVTHTVITNEDEKSIDDIRRTFVQHVGCYVDYYPNREGRFHVYSLPFTMKYLHSITNNFPGGIFTRVRILSVFDPVYSFEHDFFKRISRSFPLLNHLTVFNAIQQNEKRTRESYDHEQISSIIEFPHLCKLDLQYTHVDYVEQFLFNSNTHLPSLDQLDIEYEHLRMVTENFTSNATRVNCAKLKNLVFREEIVHSRDFYLYFPLLS